MEALRVKRKETIRDRAREFAAMLMVSTALMLPMNVKAEQVSEECKEYVKVYKEYRSRKGNTVELYYKMQDAKKNVRPEECIKSTVQETQKKTMLPKRGKYPLREYIIDILSTLGTITIIYWIIRGIKMEKGEKLIPGIISIISAYRKEKKYQKLIQEKAQKEQAQKEIANKKQEPEKNENAQKEIENNKQPEKKENILQEQEIIAQKEIANSEMQESNEKNEEIQKEQEPEKKEVANKEQEPEKNENIPNVQEIIVQNEKSKIN